MNGAAIGRRRGLSAERREAMTGLCFVLPAIVYIAALIGFPLVYNFAISFRDLDVSTFKGNSSVFVGLANYRALFADPVFLQAIGQNFFFTAACLFFQFSIGLLLALLFNGGFKAAGPIRGVIVISWMLPMSVTALLFRYMFGTESGVVNAILLGLGLIKAPIGWLVGQDSAMWAVIIANCWVGIPFNMILLNVGLESIPLEIYESATIDGASSARRFFSITLPLLKPAMLAVLMQGFIYTFKVFDLIFMMTNGGPVNATQVLSTYSYRLSFQEYNFSSGAAGAVVLFCCLMCVGAFYLKLIGRDEAM